MDETDPKITFHPITGECSHSTSYFERAKEAIKPYSELDTLIKKIKKERASEDYDCLIGISGG